MYFLSYQKSYYCVLRPKEQRETQKRDKPKKEKKKKDLKLGQKVASDSFFFQILVSNVVLIND